jgi:hypothetical protein
MPFRNLGAQPEMAFNSESFSPLQGRPESSKNQWPFRGFELTIKSAAATSGMATASGMLDELIRCFWVHQCWACWWGMMFRAVFGRGCSRRDTSEKVLINCSEFWSDTVPSSQAELAHLQTLEVLMLLTAPARSVFTWWMIQHSGKPCMVSLWIQHLETAWFDRGMIKIWNSGLARGY